MEHVEGRWRRRLVALLVTAVVVASVAGAAFAVDLCDSAARSAAPSGHLTPPPLYSVVVPAAAHAPGLDDTQWRTDLDIYMPDTFDFDFVLFLGFRPTGVDAGAVIHRDIDVPPGTSVALRDVVANLFGTTGTGSISIEVAQLGGTSLPAISTRTYNQTPEGTYGQHLAGVSFDDSLQHGEAALLVGLERSVELRTNIGFASAVPHPGAAAIELHGADGSVLSTLEVTVPAVGLYQVTDAFAVQGHPVVDVGYAVIRNTSPAVGFVTYASLVDEATGDPVTITGADVATAGESLWVAAAAHADGVGSSVWRTTLDLVNRDTSDATVTIDLLPVTGAVGSAPPARVTVPAGHAVRVDDALADLFGVAGSAALRLTPDAGSLAASSRTYNLTPAGTFGQGIPAVRADRGIGPGELGALVQLRRSAAFRTNIGVLNLTATPITVAAAFHDAAGAALGQLDLSLEPYGFQPVNGAIPGWTELDGGVALVSSPTRDAVFLAYASVVDNQTGDPTFIPAVRVATAADS